MKNPPEAKHAKQILDGAIRLTTTLLDDLNKRSGGLHPDHRTSLLAEWVPLIADYLVGPYATRRLIVTEDKRFARPVVCAWCSNRHRSVVPYETTTQGDGCAASIFQVTAANVAATQQMLWRGESTSKALIGSGDWLVKGHYGSSDYDCVLFRFVQNSPTTCAAPVCDNCIGERVFAGDLKQIEGNFP